jgi:anti-sigma-K factor RskA
MMPDAHVGTGAYVLDALPDAERRGFEEHLATCVACQAEVASLSETVARMAATAAEQPPPDLKDRVMAIVGSTGQLPPVARHSRPGPVSETPPSDEAAPEEFRAEPLAEPRRYSRRSIFALAAGVLAVAGAGGIAYDQYRAANGLRRDQDQVAAVLAESDARVVRGAVRGGGQATVVSSRRRDQAVVVVSGLAAAPQGREYQLWFIESQTHARSLGLLGRTPPTSNTLLVSGEIAKAIAFGITIEPNGGSPEPSTTPIAVITMA